MAEVSRFSGGRHLRREAARHAMVSRLWIAALLLPDWGVAPR